MRVGVTCGTSVRRLLQTSERQPACKLCHTCTVCAGPSSARPLIPPHPPSSARPLIPPHRPCFLVAADLWRSWARRSRIATNPRTDVSRVHTLQRSQGQGGGCRVWRPGAPCQQRQQPAVGPIHCRAQSVGPRRLTCGESTWQYPSLHLECTVER